MVQPRQMCQLVRGTDACMSPTNCIFRYARRRRIFLEILWFNHDLFTLFRCDLATRTVILRPQILKILACGAQNPLFPNFRPLRGLISKYLDRPPHPPRGSTNLVVINIWKSPPYGRDRAVARNGTASNLRYGLVSPNGPVNPW